jgi:hypothetical protein
MNTLSTGIFAEAVENQVLTSVRFTGNRFLC